MAKLIPDTLSAVIGSFELPSWRIAWERNRLVWQEMGPEYEVLTEEEIEPSDEQWQDFWAELDEIQVWDWDSFYFNRSDGEQTVVSWELEILLNDGRMIDSSGSNAVPGETRELKKRRSREKPPAESEEQKPDFTNDGIPTDTFDRFVAALRILVGNRVFGNPESIPEKVATPARSLTTAAPIKPVRKRRRRAKRGGKAETAGSSRSRSGRSSSRRRSTSRSKNGSGEEAPPKRRRRRRRKGPAKSAAGESNRSQSSKSEGDSSKNPAGRRRRRRRRGRRRKGPGGSTSSGQSST